VARATPWLIDRSDLLAALDRAAARKVTVISAPAGSGKTSLLRAWAGRPGQPRRLAVLQVQRDQQDAQQFWLALLDTVRQASFTTGRAGPRKCRPCTGGPPDGSSGRARRPTLSGTRRRRATGLMRPGCSPTIRSA
jgi:hypothetical protein